MTTNESSTLPPSAPTFSTPVFSTPVFSTTERDRRWALANRLMDEEGLDALLVYGDRESSFPGSFAPDAYLTNDRPGGIVILPRGGQPISLVILPTVVADHIQAARTGTPGWLLPENIYCGKVGSNVVEVLQERGLDAATIGVVGLEPYPPFYFDGVIPFATWQTIVEELPAATFREVGARFFDLTSVKSDEELAVLRFAAGAGERMCQAMLDAARPGAGEQELYAAAMHACHQHGAYSTGIILGSGDRFVGWGFPAWTYRPQAPRVLGDGDVVLAEVFCSFGMLETQQQPAIAVGRVHPDVERSADAARRSYLAGVELLRDGVPFGDVVAAMRRPMRAVDGWQVHPLVHSISPFGRIGAGDRTLDVPEAAAYGKVLPIPNLGLEEPLREGQVFAFEPNCAIGDHLVNLGGTVVVGRDHGTELNHLPTRLMRATC